ncbi:DUF2934 domain-containing protein [Paracoccus sp. (in: a-proteobacteria)]|uniref:DUF2934 domain-containing protein n=1 Tax=Paracoccus sp. TaxID=267 RepID=UPI0032D8C05E
MMTDVDKDDLIRARAHQIWENEGCPEGQEADHWARATAEIEAGAGQPEAAQSAADSGERAEEEGNVPSAVAGPAARRRAAR